MYQSKYLIASLWQICKTAISVNLQNSNIDSQTKSRNFWVPFSGVKSALKLLRLKQDLKAIILALIASFILFRHWMSIFDHNHALRKTFKRNRRINKIYNFAAYCYWKIPPLTFDLVAPPPLYQPEWMTEQYFANPSSINSLFLAWPFSRWLTIQYSQGLEASIQ